MGIVELIILIVFAGFCLFMLTKIPMDATIASILRAIIIFIVVIAVILWAAGVLGLGVGRINLN